MVHLALAVRIVDHSEVQRQLLDVSIVVLQGQEVPSGEREMHVDLEYTGHTIPCTLASVCVYLYSSGSKEARW